MLYCLSQFSHYSRQLNTAGAGLTSIHNTTTLQKWSEHEEALSTADAESRLHEEQHFRNNNTKNQHEESDYTWKEELEDQLRAQQSEITRLKAESEEADQKSNVIIQELREKNKRWGEIIKNVVRTSAKLDIHVFLSIIMLLYFLGCIIAFKTF